MENLKKKRTEYLLAIECCSNFIGNFDLETVKIIKNYSSVKKKKSINEAPLKILADWFDFLRAILLLSKSFNLKKSKYFQSEIIINFIDQKLGEFNKNFYNSENGEFGNWWHWEIGYPLEILDILLLIGDKLDKKLVNSLIETTRFFQKDPRYSGNNSKAIHPSGTPLRATTGANRVDTIKVSLLRAILTNNSLEITDALSILSTVWEEKKFSYKNYGENRDGFYSDGSFVQHGSIPYTGTYGNVLLKGIGEILYLFSCTDYLKKISDIEKIYEKIFTSFEPLFFKGAMPDFVNGRSLSRIGHWDHQIGHEILDSLFLLALGAPEKYREKILKIFQREITLDKSYNHLEMEKNPFLYVEISIFLDNLKKNPYPLYPREIRCFNDMGRIFVRDQDYALGIALHSDRIGNYESMNGENLEGWFTGDGAYYLYNKNLTQYQNYWNSLDMKYIPGTTEIKMDMTGINSQKNYETTHSHNKWAGGVTLDGYCVAGMKFHNFSNELSSRKSWFILPGGVLFIEDNIVSEKEIYSTLFNKKIKDKEKIFIDGEIFDDEKISGYIKEITISETLYRIKSETFINIIRDKKTGFIRGTMELKGEKIVLWELILEEKKYSDSSKELILKIDESYHILYNNKIILFNNWNKIPIDILQSKFRKNSCGIIITTNSEENFRSSFFDPEYKSFY